MKCRHTDFEVHGVEVEGHVFFYVAECSTCHHYAGDKYRSAAIEKLAAGEISTEPSVRDKVGVQ